MTLTARSITLLSVVALPLFLSIPQTHAQAQDPSRVALIFSGGHDTDPRDHGRPVSLVAAALNVSADVFREAFSHVTPASGGREPEPRQVRLNKQALLGALSPYGVNNDRLDTVSNYYRYNRAGGELVWRSTPAAAYATMRDGVVTGFTITDAGSGYSSAPAVSIPGMPKLRVNATLSFGTDLSKNGSIKQLVHSE